MQLDGEYKIAQYGQWDGYPEGQGLTVLRFLKSWDRPKFEEALRNCSFLSAEELQEIYYGEEPLPEELSRDTCAKILNLVQISDGLRLANNIDFAKDSLFCEWAYVIDLDRNTLEVFSGFVRAPIEENERFYGEINEDGFYPIRLKEKWNLYDLPSEEEFLTKLNEGEGG